MTAAAEGAAARSGWLVLLIATAAGGLAGTACVAPDDLVARTRGASTAGGAGGAGGGAASPSLFDCVRPALSEGDPALVALYGFEEPEGSTSVLDATGRQPGSVLAGTFAGEVGPAGCGQAVAFGVDERRVLLPDSPAWDLAVGSVDFWFRVPSDFTVPLSLLGRDEQGTVAPGHLSIWLTAQRTVTLRLQGAAQQATRCSALALDPGAWVHVGFNFGPPGLDLYVNGALAERSGDPQVDTIVPNCGTTTLEGISGNDLPWILGADTSRTDKPLVVVDRHFSGGALDALRISSVRRAY